MELKEERSLWAREGPFLPVSGQGVRGRGQGGKVKEHSKRRSSVVTGKSQPLSQEKGYSLNLAMAQITMEG